MNKYELINKKHKKIYKGVLNYIEHLFILLSTLSGCVSISAFASFTDIFQPSSAIGLKICVRTAGIKKYEPIIKKKKKKHHRLFQLAKYKLNSVEVLTSKALIDSNVSQDKFFFINNVPKEFDDMIEEIKITMKNESLNCILQPCYLIV